MECCIRDWSEAGLLDTVGSCLGGFWMSLTPPVLTPPRPLHLHIQHPAEGMEAAGVEAVAEEEGEGEGEEAM